MSRCERCGKWLDTDTPRDFYEGKIYHIFCGWKLRRDDAEKKGATHDDPLHPRGGSDPCVPKQ